jgi:hypothetical protein
MPLILASVMLLYHERHLSLRTSLSETQRIFTSSWWTGDSETVAGRDRPRRANVQQAAFDPNAPLEVALATDNVQRTRAQALALRRRWFCEVHMVLLGSFHRHACLCPRRGICRDVFENSTTQHHADDRVCLHVGYHGPFAGWIDRIHTGR